MLIFLVIPKANAQIQTAGNIQCGDIVEGEVIAGQSQKIQRLGVDKYVDDYMLEIPAGTRINLTVDPLGGTFNTAFALVDSGDNDILIVNDGVEGEAENLRDFPLGSSNQILRVVGAMPGRTTSRELGAGYFYGWDTFNSANAGSYFGAYAIRIGCTMRDGTVIEPGDTLPDSTGSGNDTAVVTAPIFSGTGFPGLAPVDFANAFKLPLSLGTAMPGQIPPSGESVLGLTFDASAGDTFALDFARTSGNLNLGVVVLSANNEVVFQASLVTSQSLSTRLTLPSAGQYTIGVFRIDLLPPAAPEATQFQITGTLNP
jgi:hypothetical protein